MPNNINLKADLSTLDFSQVGRLTADDAQAQALFNKPGKISLDDKGELFVINPNAKRNNAFVRFFKGILTRNKAYMNEQHAIDRYEKLKNNASFADKASRELINIAAASKAKANISADDLVFTALKNLRINSQSEALLNTDTLKQALTKSQQTYEIFAKVHSEFENAADRDPYSSLIYLDGKTLDARSFCAQYAQDKSLPSPAKIGTALLNAVTDSDSSEIAPELISSRDQQTITSLLARDKATLKRADYKPFIDAVPRVARNFEHKLASLAAEALSNNKDPHQVASLIADAYNIFAAERDSVLAFDQIFSYENDSIKTKLSDLKAVAYEEEISPELRAKLDEVKRTFPDFTDKQCSQILNFCQSSNTPFNAVTRYAAQFQTISQLMHEYTSIEKYFDDSYDSSEAPQAIAKFFTKFFSDLKNIDEFNPSSPDDRANLAKVAALLECVTGNIMSVDMLDNLDYITNQLGNFIMTHTVASGSFKPPKGIAAEDTAEQQSISNIDKVISILQNYISAMKDFNGYCPDTIESVDPLLIDPLTKARNHMSMDFDAILKDITAEGLVDVHIQSAWAKSINEAAEKFPDDIRPQVKAYLKAIMHKNIDSGMDENQFNETLTAEVSKLIERQELLIAMTGNSLAPERAAALQKSLYDELKSIVTDLLRNKYDFERDNDIADSFFSAVQENLISVNGMETTMDLVKDDIGSLNIPEGFTKPITLLAGKLGLIQRMQHDGIATLSGYSISSLLNDTNQAIVFERQPKVDISFDSATGIATITYTCLNKVEEQWDKQTLCQEETSVKIEIDTNEGLEYNSYPSHIALKELRRTPIKG